MIEEFVPSDHQKDNFYESFTEERTRDLNNAGTTEEHDSFPFPIEPLRSFPPTNKPKRLRRRVKILELLPHLLLLAPLCYLLQFPRKRQPPIHLLHSVHKLLNCHIGKISVQISNLFVTVPPEWLAIALNCAQI